MPATRSGAPSRQARSAAFPSPKQKKKSSAQVINASASPMSGSREPSAVPLNQSRSNSKSKSSRGSANLPQEVIEISSDEDEPPIRRTPAPSSSTVAELRRQVRKLKEEKNRFKQEAETLHHQLELNRQKLRSLEIARSLNGDKIALNNEDLGDIISCNICTNTMFVPYILSGCGHTFCQKCLIEWFDATLRNFLSTHPHYNPNNPYPPGVAVQIARTLQHPQVLTMPQVMAFLQAHMPQQPEYTCPECRALVKSPPIENYGMKSLSQIVASARQEAIPPTPPRPRARVWDRYFPTQ